MAQSDLTSEKSQEGQAQPSGTADCQRAKDCLLKGVSYFAGDMKVFGKWMESESTLNDR